MRDIKDEILPALERATLLLRETHSDLVKVEATTAKSTDYELLSAVEASHMQKLDLATQSVACVAKFLDAIVQGDIAQWNTLTPDDLGARLRGDLAIAVEASSDVELF